MTDHYRATSLHAFYRMRNFNIELVQLSVKGISTDAKRLGNIADIPAMLR